MSNIVKKNKEELEKINQLLSKYEIKIAEGDIFFNTDGTHTYAPLIKIREISISKYDEQQIVVHFNCSENWEGTEWRSYGSDNIDIFINRYGSKKLVKPLNEYLNEADKILSGEKSIDEYKDNTNISAENALVHASSKEYLQILQSGLKEKENYINLIHESIKFQIEKKRQQLEAVREQLSGVLSEFRKKVSKLEEVIWMIELYLGINEKIIQIKEGPKANADTVIYFRQETLFMDEEVGDPEDSGIDFQRIEQFDEWISKNINRILPEEKSVVVFRVRRDDKKYSDNPFINRMLNRENKETYVLIKNGECLYRIWGDIKMGERLFPQKAEFLLIQEKIIKNVEEGNERYVKQLKEDLDNKSIIYQRQLIMLQGLFDRTEVFSPYGERIKLISADIHDSGRVKFIYDGEIKLPDNKIPYWDWHKNINENLQEGDRIIIGGSYENVDIKDRLDDRYSSEYREIKAPNNGLYTVELYKRQRKDAIYIDNPDYNKNINENYNNRKQILKKDSLGQIEYREWVEEFLCIRYNPKDTVYNLWDRWSDAHDRKNRLSFKIYPNDKFLINFDKVNNDDIEFYLNSRVNRRHYLKMMPLLYKIKQLKIEEKEAEKDFIIMIKGELIKSYKGDHESIIIKGINWWKLKNKWKRSLKSDDAKAYRMIINWIKKNI